MNNEYNLNDIIACLSEPTPIEAIEEKNGRGGGTMYYVGREYVQGRLNEVAWGRWSISFNPLVMTDDMWAVECTISIDGVSRADVGYAPKTDAEMPKSAYTDALKRAATMWGIGLDLYREDHAKSGKAPKPALATHWSQDPAKATAFILALDKRDCTLTRALEILQVKHLGEIVSGREAMQTVDDYFATLRSEISQVDLDDTEEIPYQQTEQADSPSELEQYLPKKRTSKPLPAGHWLKKGMGQFWIDVGKLGYDHDSLLALVGLESLSDLPMTRDETWALINQKMTEKQRRYDVDLSKI